MKKINPIKEKTLQASQNTYDDLFKDIGYYIKTKLKARGIHDLIAYIYAQKIKNKNVLDIGCGLGRFSFISSRTAKQVVGIDMTENAISCAKIIQNSLNIKNIDFILSTIEDYETDQKFDFILLSGTLEHIIDVDMFFKKIKKLLKPSGTFITDSPSEFNFRGIFHASLWKLFNFPMTLSDVRIVTPNFIKDKCKQYDMELIKTVGTLFSRGWGKAAVYDLKERIPNVLKDVEKETSQIDINVDNYINWLEDAGNVFENLLENWEKTNLISRISEKREFNFKLEKKVLNKYNLPVEDIKEYLSPDFSIDPFYSENEEISLLGGNIIYEIYQKRK
jgi:SAM-dependent methyltransferase